MKTTIKAITACIILFTASCEGMYQGKALVYSTNGSVRNPLPITMTIGPGGVPNYCMHLPPPMPPPLPHDPNFGTVTVVSSGTSQGNQAPVMPITPGQPFIMPNGTIVSINLDGSLNCLPPPPTPLSMIPMPPMQVQPTPVAPMPPVQPGALCPPPIATSKHTFSGGPPSASNQAHEKKESAQLFPASTDTESPRQNSRRLVTFNENPNSIIPQYPKIIEPEDFATKPLNEILIESHAAGLRVTSCEGETVEITNNDKAIHRIVKTASSLASISRKESTDTFIMQLATNVCEITKEPRSNEQARFKLRMVFAAMFALSQEFRCQGILESGESYRLPNLKDYLSQEVFYQIYPTLVKSVGKLSKYLYEHIDTDRSFNEIADEIFSDEKPLTPQQPQLLEEMKAEWRRL
ncbi:hypothetical protein HOD08_01780 [bacterium]|nr:hypothetical protein [bacterium]